MNPDNVRPLRQVVDEISWLLGSQFSIQTIGNHADNFSHVLCGAAESVFRNGKERLNAGWRFETHERADTVVVAVDAPAGPRDWFAIGAAIDNARRIVARDGRIVVLSTAGAEPDVGLRMLAGCEEASDVLKPLRLESPPDVVPATQIVNAIQHARVFLLSQHDSEQIEDLLITPVAQTDEVLRLVQNDRGTVAFVNSAQNVYAFTSD